MLIVMNVALAVLTVSGGLCLARLLRGRSVPDRIVALDTLLLVAVMGIAVASARSGSGAFLNLLFVAALIAFVGTVTVAAYVERRGA